MQVYIEKTREIKDLKFKGTASRLLELLKINSEQVIITRNNELVTLDQEIGGVDKIKILSVISGG